MTEFQGLTLAFVCGVGYNALLDRSVRSQRRSGRSADGFTAFWVIGGVFITLLIAAFVEVSMPRLVFYWQGVPIQLTNQQHAVIYLFKFFCASGIPMTVGALWRHLVRLT